MNLKLIYAFIAWAVPIKDVFAVCSFGNEGWNTDISNDTLISLALHTLVFLW